MGDLLSRGDSCHCSTDVAADLAAASECSTHIYWSRHGTRRATPCFLTSHDLLPRTTQKRCKTFCKPLPSTKTRRSYLPHPSKLAKIESLAPELRQSSTPQRSSMQTGSSKTRRNRALPSATPSLRRVTHATGSTDDSATSMASDLLCSSSTIY